MKESIKESIGMLLLCFLFFALSHDAVFIYTSKIFRLILYVCGGVTFLAFIGCVSDIFNKRNPYK